MPRFRLHNLRRRNLGSSMLPRKNIYRILDANINRAKEGLRVCEEVTRFLINSRPLTLEFKKARHKIDSVIRLLSAQAFLFKERKAWADVGKNIYVQELERKDFKDIFFANIQRVKESIRVLEEFSKLINRNSAIEFKKLRYRMYEIEKISAKKILPLRSC